MKIVHYSLNRIKQQSLSGLLAKFLAFVLGEMCGFAAHFPQNKTQIPGKRTTKSPYQVIWILLISLIK